MTKSKKKRLPRSQRQARHQAKITRMRARKHTKRTLESVVSTYVRALRHAHIAGELARLGVDIYVESGAVVCDKCGLLQAYEVDDEAVENADRIALCQGFEGVGCGGETCITYSRYVEELGSAFDIRRIRNTRVVSDHGEVGRDQGARPRARQRL